MTIPAQCNVNWCSSTMFLSFQILDLTSTPGAIHLHFILIFYTGHGLFTFVMDVGFFYPSKHGLSIAILDQKINS